MTTKEIHNKISDGDFELLVGDNALVVDLFKLRMGKAKEISKDIRTNYKALPLFHGYIFGYHDFMILNKISSMDSIYDRSNIDRIERHLNSHHRVFVFSYKAKLHEGGNKSTFHDFTIPRSGFKNSPILTMSLVNVNYNALGKIVNSNHRIGAIDIFKAFISAAYTKLSSAKNLLGFSIGGTLGLHSFVIFIKSNSISSAMDAIFNIRTLKFEDILCDFKIKFKDSNSLQTPFTNSTFSTPCVNYNVSNDKLSNEDKITAIVRMKSVPGASIEHSNILTKHDKLGGVHLPATGRYDYVVKYDNVLFRDFYKHMNTFLQDPRRTSNIVWATATSICKDSGSFPEDDFYDQWECDALDEINKSSFNKCDRTPRPVLSQGKVDRDVWRALNKASSIGYIARHDIDNFAYADLIPFYKRGWVHYFYLNVLDNVIDKILKAIKSKYFYIPFNDFLEFFVTDAIFNEPFWDELSKSSNKDEYTDVAQQILRHIEDIAKKHAIDRPNKCREVHLRDLLTALNAIKRDESDLYIETIATLQVARLQRHWGTRTSFHTYIFNPSNFEGGIHLLFHCLGAYVNEIYDMVNHTAFAKGIGRNLYWSGFFNVDPNPLNVQFLTRLHIISMPLRELLDVKQVILDISHEAAHSVLISTGVSRLAYKYCAESIFRDRNIIDEALCDILVFTTGFRGNIKTYYSWVTEIFSDSFLQYDKPHHAAASFEGFFRLFCIYLFHKSFEFDEKLNYKYIPDLKRRYTIKDELIEFIAYIDALFLSSPKEFKSIGIALQWIIRMHGKFDDYLIENGVLFIDLLNRLYLHRTPSSCGTDSSNGKVSRLLEVLCHHLIDKDYSLTHTLSNIFRDCNLSNWTNTINNLPISEYNKFKNSLSHEFIYALTNFVRDNANMSPSIGISVLSVLVNFDISMRCQYWKNIKIENYAFDDEWV